MAILNSSEYVLIPGTTRFVRKDDINGVVLRGKLSSSTALIMPENADGNFTLQKGLDLQIEALISLAGYKLAETVVTEKEAEEVPEENAEGTDYPDEHLVLELKEYGLNGQTVDLLTSSEYANLDEDQRTFVDSKIRFYKKTLVEINERNSLQAHVAAEKEEEEEEVGATGVRDVKTSPTATEQILSRLNAKLEGSQLKQESRVAALQGIFNISEILKQEDNIFKLTDSLYLEGRLDSESLVTVNSNVRAILEQFFGALNFQSYRDYYSPYEENAEKETTEDTAVFDGESLSDFTDAVEEVMPDEPSENEAE